MQQSAEWQKEMSDPEGQSCELLQLFASALAVFKQIFDLRDQFGLLIRVQAYNTVEEVEAPSNPIHQGSKCTLTPTKRNAENSTKDGKKSSGTAVELVLVASTRNHQQKAKGRVEPK